MSTTVVFASALFDVHVWLAWVVVGLNVVAGVWALVAHRVEGARHRSLWWFTAVAEATIAVQVLIGVLVRRERFPDGDPDHLGIHMFYGYLALFAMAILYSYRGQLRAHLHLLYGVGGLFLAGLALRAIALQ